jgi:hypothetical protein
MMQARTPQCALAQLYGVDATVAEIRGGVAIRFTAPAEEREKLREILRDMAQPREEGNDIFAGCTCATIQWGRLAGGPSGGEPASEMNASKQKRRVVLQAVPREDDTPNGAVLRLRAETDEDAAVLAAAVREKVESMRNCR